MVGKTTLVTIPDAHTGTSAPLARGIGTGSQEFELGVARRVGCAIPVTAGHAYTTELWYRATYPVSPRIYVDRGAAGWKRWLTAPTQPASDTWRRAVVTTPTVMAGVSSMSVAMWSAANGDVALDDVATTDLGVRPPDASRELFRAVFGWTDALVTNEYAYWNPEHADAIRSGTWEMTSGSLFASASGAYSGTPDLGRPDAGSTGVTDSAVFRLNTRSRAYRDVVVSFQLNLARLTSTANTPVRAWDGVHVWLRYQSQYELYVAEVARRDGRVVIKKKCPGGTSNGGTYHELSDAVSGYAVPLGAWIDAAASVRNNSDGTVTLALYRDGTEVVRAVDRGVGCAPITAAGAVGLRGDNAEFRFRDFVVATA